MDIKIDRFRLEPLTALVMTLYGPLFLTRILPGRWLIQAGGSPDERGLIWDGEQFSKLPSSDRSSSITDLAISESDLGDALAAAREGLKAERAVNSTDRSVSIDEEQDDG